MIPKKIHYCWFGGAPKPADVAENIARWHAVMPDYEIVEWNEGNFDVDSLPYVREAYLSGNYAFVSDVARLKVLYDQGGVYLDTDVEVLKPFDNYLPLHAFLGREGQFLGTAVMGSEPGAEWLGAWLRHYSRRHFINALGHAMRRPNVRVLTEDIYPALPETDRPVVFPSNRFSAKDYKSGEIMADPSTVAIHHFNASWRRHKSVIDRARLLVAGFAIRHLRS